MFLLDTNVISELRKARAGKADRNVAAWVRLIPAGSLFLSAIVIQELEIGTLFAERETLRQGDPPRLAGRPRAARLCRPHPAGRYRRGAPQCGSACPRSPPDPGCADRGNRAGSPPDRGDPEHGTLHPNWRTAPEPMERSAGSLTINQTPPNVTPTASSAPRAGRSRGVRRSGGARSAGRGSPAWHRPPARRTR